MGLQIAEKKAVREEKVAVKELSKEEIQNLTGAKDLGTVGKKAGETWKNMKDCERKPYEDKAKAQKDAYDTYINSAEGQAALQKYKDEVSAIKSKRSSEKTQEFAAEADAEAPKAKRAKAAAGA